ncbi:MAG TPA: aspartyl protease family protein [Caulobacteraceae bacterium]
MKVRSLLFALALTGVAATAHAGCTLSKFAEFPVTMVGLTPLIDVSVNGAPARFILDSGATISEITPAKAAEFKLATTPLPPSLAMQGVGGLEFISAARVRSFDIAGAKLSGLVFLVGGNEFQSGAAGLLGQNFLHLADQEYDMAHGVARLWRAEGCAGGGLAYWAPQGPYSVVEQAPNDHANFQAVADAYVNGVKIRVMLDTGASTSVLSLAAAKRAGIDISSPAVKVADAMTGLGRRQVTSWIAPVDSFKFGDEQILHTHLRIGEFSGLDTDMLLGEDFLLSHRVLVADSQNKIYFTYNGGVVFNLTTAPDAKDSPIASTAGEAPPADAAGFGRRAAAHAARREFEPAIADLTHAIELAPKDPDWLFQRGVVRLRINQSTLAMADFTAALGLRPDDADALMGRAELRLRDHDAAGGRTDLSAADKVLPKDAENRLGLAALYERADARPAAIGQYDLWIKAHPDDAGLGEALNGRCWDRALLGTELDKALADCQGALRRAPGSWLALDSRGLVRLRQGNYDQAITDYDSALAIEPKSAWSLYGRGLAKLKTGHAEEAKADLAAAGAIDPTVAKTAAKYSIEP